MAKKDRVAPVLDGPKPAVEVPAPVPADGKAPEDTQQYAMTGFQSGALRAAQDNRNRAAADAQNAQVQFADLVEEVVDEINEKHKTKHKVEDVRNINVKKGLISIALGATKKPK